MKREYFLFKRAFVCCNFCIQHFFGKSQYFAGLNSKHYQILDDTDKDQDGVEGDIKVIMTSTLCGRGQNILGVYWHKANRLRG